MIKQLLFISLLGLALAIPNSKVEPRLSKSLSSKHIANVFVKFGNSNRDIIHSVDSLQFNTRAGKTTHLVSALKSLSQSSQRNAVELLRSPLFAMSAISFKQFWVSNELYVKGASPQLIQQLEALPEVSEIREERVIQIDDFAAKGVASTLENNWNLEKVEAANAWGLPGGNNGQGVVVEPVTNPSVRGNYRADYGWFDPYSGTEVASDSQGHGTHTMGTIAGTGVGVAPGAQWVACQGCFFIFCTEEALKACGQWTLCPTRPNGTDADCSKAPQVVSNSWGRSQGGDAYFNDVIDAWKAADIIPVFAIGNDGTSCGTARSPGDQAVIGVGATTEGDDLSDFSSVGPTADGVVKPDISAPGTDVYSALSNSDDAYGLMSGTSMACPHVAGAVALLLSSNPNLKYDQVKNLLQNNTDTSSLVDTGAVCGGRNSTTFPNNQYGHGRLNTRKALAAAISNL